MNRPLKKAIGFLTALTYSAALFCAASMTAAAEDVHGDNRGGSTADDTWNNYTTSKALDSVNSAAIFGNQFSVYFEAADLSGGSFSFNPETTITMVTEDGTTTRIRNVDNIDTIYSVASGSVITPLAMSNTSVSEIHTVLTGADETSSGGYLYNTNLPFLYYSRTDGGFSVILPNGTLLEDGKAFDEVVYGGCVNARIGDTWYFYSLDGEPVDDYGLPGVLEFYDKNTGIRIYRDKESDAYYPTFHVYNRSNTEFTTINISNVYGAKALTGYDGEHYVALPYEFDIWDGVYYYDYYDATGTQVPEEQVIPQEEPEETASTDYSRGVVYVESHGYEPDENDMMEYEVIDPDGRTVYTYKGKSMSGSKDGYDIDNYIIQNGRVFIAAEEGLVVLDAYTGRLITKNTDFSYYNFQYVSSEGGHLIVSVGEMVETSWGEVYRSTGVVLFNMDGVLLSEKYDTMKPTAEYSARTSFIVSREIESVGAARYGMISGRGNLVVQLIYTGVYYGDKDITIFNRENSYQDVFSSPTGKQYASDILMRGSSSGNIRYYDKYILLLTQDKYSKDKIGAIVIR